MSSSPLKVLFVPFKGVGHINACIGLAQVVTARGHRVVFAIEPEWTHIVAKYGFETVDLVIDDPDKSDNPIKTIGEEMVATGNIGDSSPLEKALKRAKRWTKRVDYYFYLDAALKPVLDSISPDVICMDQFLTVPCIELSGIPWVWVWSAGPLYMYGFDEDVPPQSLGLSSIDKSQWKDHRDKVVDAMRELWTKWNNNLVAKGLKPLDNKSHTFMNGSPFLNVYAFPEPLDYTDLKPLPKNYHRFDNLMRTEAQKEFEIPEQLRDRPGKLIYFSLGSMASVDVNLMKRLIEILGDSQHRFIVSKGPNHDKFELADNMWGQRSVPQIQILPVVDLVITHGGNNTLCETFFFGKPMIVLPIFGDQPDNAQRIHDKGFGINLNPYRCSKQELLDAIEKLLNDKELNRKLEDISKQIRNRNILDNFGDLLEQLVNNKPISK